MAAGMSKLHELLAVHKSHEGQASKVRTDLMSVFEKKRHHFEETRKSFKSLVENEPAKVEEQKDIQTTVAAELKWVKDKIASVLDVGYQIDVANTGARADVVVDGTILLNSVPATALLQMEKRCQEVKALLLTIPTLDPAKGFKPDAEKGKGIYKARDVEKPRTKKTKKVYTLAKATEKHPEQAQLLDEDVITGTILEQEWSAFITPSEKSDALERLEKVARAVQKARAKANEHEIDPSQNKIGEKVLAYVFGSLVA